MTSPDAVRSRPRAWRPAVLELGSAVLFLPRLVLVALLLLALPAVAAANAWGERARARLAGLDVPEPRRASRGASAYLARRSMSRQVWVRDVPLLLCTLVLDLVAFLGVLAGGTVGGVLVGATVIVVLAHRHEVEVQYIGWTPSVAESVVLVPLGLIVITATCWALVVLGRARVSLLRALTEDREAELEQQVGKLASSRATLVGAFESERRRIERDLHDGAQQRLVALSLSLGRAARAAESEDAARRAAVPEHLTAAQAEAEEALAALREAVRAIHPQVLTDRGLFAAVRELASRAGVRAAVTTSGDDADVSSPVAVAVYFAVSEALTNVAKHAGVDAATVEVTVDAAQVRAVVADAGRGGAGIGRGEATGLAGLAERLEALGGRLDVDSAPGAGTTVTATVPLVPGWDR